MRKFLLAAIVAVAALVGKVHAFDEYTYPGAYDPAVQMCFDVANSSDTVPATGQKKLYQRAPYNFTASAWSLTADQSGSAAVAVWKDSLANFPPTSADLISLSTPSASSVLWSSGTTSGWSTTSINQGELVDINIVSIASWVRFQFCITGKRN